jgi:hypothetical protein
LLLTDHEEIASLRAELAGLNTEHNSVVRGWQAHDLRLRAELANATTWAKQIMDSQNAIIARQEATARQDAETIERMTKALEFYANRESWEQDGTRADGYMSPMFRDMGEVASTALACRPQAVDVTPNKDAAK